MMRDDRFTSNAWPTLGVEVELQLVDARTMALRSAIAPVIAGLPPELKQWVKPEFMQCYVEINSAVCRTANELEWDLARKVRGVEATVAKQGLRLFWSATHPFSRWQDQQITPNERYFRLAETLRETVTRPVTFGLHVHVGVKSGDLAAQISDRLQPYLPLFLALSANSPFWEGRCTGHQAHRIEILEGFPTGGLPPLFGNWEGYLTLVAQMVAAGFIDSAKELWWDIRPNPESGTIEVRICDMPPDMETVVGLTALIQSLVHDLSARIERGEPWPASHPLLLRQNRWRACRFGLDTELVDPVTLEAQPARRFGEALVRRLAGVAADLGCARQLERVLEVIHGATGAERQSAIFEETGSLAEVVRRSLQHSRLSPFPAPVGLPLFEVLTSHGNPNQTTVRP